jgi:hypothetical protein
MRLQLLDAVGQAFPVAPLCQVLNVSHYGYSARRSRPASPRQREYLVPLVHIRSTFARSHSTYVSYVRLESYRTRDFQPSEPPKPTRRSTEQIRTGRPSLRFSRVLPTPEWSSAPDFAQNAGAWILAKHPNRLAKRSFRDTIACSLLHCLHKRGKKQALLPRGVTTPIASGSLEGGSEQLHLPRLKAGLDGPVRIRFRGVTGGPYNRSLSWAAPEHDHPYLGSGPTHFACGDSESEEV